MANRPTTTPGQEPLTREQMNLWNEGIQAMRAVFVARGFHVADARFDQAARALKTMYTAGPHGPQFSDGAARPAMTPERRRELLMLAGLHVPPAAAK